MSGEAIEGIRRMPSRVCEGVVGAREGQETPTQLTLSSDRERAVVLLAAALLDEFAHAGAACVDRGLLDTILTKCAKGMRPRQLMRTEIEAHRIIEWLATSLSPRGQFVSEPLEHVHPNTTPRAILRWGIHKGRDLSFDYWDSERGELQHQTITPMALEADKYVRGISHVDKEERLFEVRRLTDLRPSEGWPVHHTEGAHPDHAPLEVWEDEAAVRAGEKGDRALTPRTQAQMSLLGLSEEE